MNDSLDIVYDVNSYLNNQSEISDYEKEYICKEINNGIRYATSILKTEEEKITRTF